VFNKLDKLLSAMLFIFTFSCCDIIGKICCLENSPAPIIPTFIISFFAGLKLTCELFACELFTFLLVPQDLRSSVVAEFFISGFFSG